MCLARSAHLRWAAERSAHSAVPPLNVSGSIQWQPLQRGRQRIHGSTFRSSKRVGESALGSPGTTMPPREPQERLKRREKLAKILPRPSQIPTDPSPNPSKIDSNGFLEPILDQCFTKARFRRPKKFSRSGQKRPKEAPDGPRPLQNRAQDPPKTNFYAIFYHLFSHFEFESLF